MAAASSADQQQQQQKKKANLVSPFVNVHLSSTLGLVAEATRASIIKNNPVLAAAAAAKKKAGVPAGDDDNAEADDDLLAQIKLDPRQVATAAFKTSVRVVVITPSLSKVKPMPARNGKKAFPGFCTFTAMVLEPPGVKGNVVGLRTPGNSLAPHGRAAYLAAQQLEKTGYDEDTQKNKFEQVATDEKAILTEGVLIELTVTGQVARPTHRIDGTKVPDELLGAQPELKQDDVALITIDEIVLRDGGIQARAKRIQPLGTTTDHFSNAVLHAYAEAGQRPFTPLVVSDDYDWASVKVERKKKDGEAAAPAPAAGGDQEGGGGGEAMDEDSPSNDKPNNEKVQKVGSACMTLEASRALWTNYMVGTFGVPRDTQLWREAAGMPMMLNGSPVFDPTDPLQWVKKQKEDAPAHKPGDTVEVQIRYVVPTRQIKWTSPIQCAVTPVLLNQTVPQLLLHRFGVSDPDFQPFVRAMISNGVFAMMASPMTQGWMTRYFEGAEFTQAFYPKIHYVGEKGSKKPDVKSAAFYVDHACTLLNTTVPVTREFVMVLMLLMSMFVNKKRFNYDMTAVKKADRKDRANRQIEDNYLDTRTDNSGEQAVVNVFECQYNMAKELVGHAFYALLEELPKSAEVLQQVFAAHDEAAVPAYFSAMLMQALMTQVQQLPNSQLTDPLRPIDAANVFLKKVADDVKAQAEAGLCAPLPDDFVRPSGAPSLRELLAKDSPLYIGDNALGLDADQIKGFRVLPWAISRIHLESRGLPTVYPGVAVHYDVVYPRVATEFDDNDGLMPIEKMIEQRKQEIAPLLEAEARRREEEESKITPEEEAALKKLEQIEAAAAAAALAAVNNNNQGKPAQPPHPVGAKPAPAPVPQSPVHRAKKAAATPIKSALTASLPKSAGGIKRTTTGQPAAAAATAAATEAPEDDGESEQSRRRRKMPASFQQSLQEDQEGDVSGEEEDMDSQDGDATQPQEYAGDNNGGVLTLAPDS